MKGHDIQSVFFLFVLVNLPPSSRQVKLIHKGRLGDDDLQQCVLAIRKNAVECMQGVLRAMDNFDISLGLAENAPRKKVRRLVLRTYSNQYASSNGLLTAALVVPGKRCTTLSHENIIDLLRVNIQSKLS